MFFYVVTGRRSGQPSSSSSGKEGLRPRICRFRWYCCFFAVRRYVTGTRLLPDRPLGHPDVRKRPWPLRRPREDGNGGRFVRSALPSFVARFAPLRCTSDAVTLTFVSFCSLYSNSPLSCRPQPLGVSETILPVKTQGRTLDCSFNFRPPRIVAGCFFLLCVAGPSGLMRASEQSVVRHTHSLRCESATWVAAQRAVPEAVTRARHSQQRWVSCPELPDPLA